MTTNLDRSFLLLLCQTFPTSSSRSDDDGRLRVVEWCNRATGTETLTLCLTDETRCRRWGGKVERGGSEVDRERGRVDQRGGEGKCVEKREEGSE